MIKLIFEFIATIMMFVSIYCLFLLAYGFQGI